MPMRGGAVFILGDREDALFLLQVLLTRLHCHCKQLLIHSWRAQCSRIKFLLMDRQTEWQRTNKGRKERKETEGREKRGGNRGRDKGGRKTGQEHFWAHKRHGWVLHFYSWTDWVGWVGVGEKNQFRSFSPPTTIICTFPDPKWRLSETLAPWTAVAGFQAQLCRWLDTCGRCGTTD